MRVVLPPRQTRKRWGRGEGKNWGREKIAPAFDPIGFLKLRSPADRGSGVPDVPTKCKPGKRL